METQEFRHLGDVNINWQLKDKKMFGKKSKNITNKEIPYLTRKYLELWLSHTLEQVILLNNAI